MQFMPNGFLHHSNTMEQVHSLKETIKRGYSWDVPIQSIHLKESGRDIVHGFHELSRVSFLNFKKIHNNKFVYTYRVK